MSGSTALDQEAITLIDSTFSANTANDIEDFANESPYLADLLNQYSENGGIIRLGVSGDGTLATIRDGIPLINIDPESLPDSSDNSVAAFTGIFSEELSHLLLSGGLSYIQNPSTPQEAITNSQIAEGVAVNSAIIVGIQIGLTGENGAETIPQDENGSLTSYIIELAGNAGIDLSQAQPNDTALNILTGPTSAAVAYTGQIMGQQSPSGNENITYDQLAVFLWATQNFAQIGPAQINISAITPSSIPSFTQNPDGTLEFSLSIPLLNGGTQELNGTLSSSYAPLSLASSLSLNSDDDWSYTTRFTSSGAVDSISGVGASQQINNAQISISADSEVEIDGSNNFITSSSGDTLLISGADGLGGEESPDIVTATGLAGGAAGSITLGATAQANISGSANYIVLSGANTLNISSGTGEVVDNDESGDTVNLAGNTGAIIAGSGGTVGIDGTGVSLNASGQTIYSAANVTYGLTGSNNTADLGADNTLNIGSGTSETINNDASGDTINLGAGASATISGAGGAVGVDGTGVSLIASGQTIYSAANLTYGLTGSNNTADLGADNTLDIGSGTGETINNDTSGDMVNLAADASATVAGSGGVIGIDGTDVDLDASNETIYSATNNSFSVDGSGDNINANTGDTVSLIGAGGEADTINASGPLGSGNIVLSSSGINTVDDTSGLDFTDASSVIGGNILLDASNLSLTDGAVGVLGIADLSGASGGTLTLSANGLSLVDGASGLTLATGSGVTAGYITLSASDINTIDDASGLDFTDASGVTGGNILLGASNLNLTDGAVGVLGVADQSGVSGGTLTLGANGLSLVDGASGLILTAGPGVTTGYITLNASNINTVDDASGLEFYDAPNITGGNVVLGANNLNLVDDTSGGLGIAEAAGVTGGSVVFASNSLTLVDSATTSLGVTDASGITGGSVLLASSSSAVTVGGNDIDVGDLANITGGTANLSGSGDEFSANGGSAYFGARNQLISISGEDDDVYSGSYTGDTAEISASDDTAYINNGTVDLASNISSTLVGSGLDIYEPISDKGDISLSASSGSDIIDWTGGEIGDAESWKETFDPSSSIASDISDWSGTNATGKELEQTNNLIAGGSDTYDFDTNESSVQEIIEDTTGIDDTGILTSEDLLTTSGTTEDFAFNYSSSDDELEGYTEDYYSPTDVLLGTAGYNDEGQTEFETGIVGDDEPDLDGFDLSSSTNGTAGVQKGSFISGVAAEDLNNGLYNQASAVEAAFFQAQLTALGAAQPGIISPSATPIRWSSNTITWAFATDSGTAAAPISGAIGAQYQTYVEQAFAAWDAATGLNLTEVSNPAQADVEIGWGDFETASSGVLGLTTSPTASGALQQGAIIRLEDPTDTALVTDANGQLSYAGTEAEFSQLILHEIGHALGLGDSSDPTSIMYSIADSEDRAISASDEAAIQALYAISSPATAAGATSASAEAQTTSAAATSAQTIDVSGALQLTPLGPLTTPTDYGNAPMVSNLIQAIAGFQGATPTSAMTSPPLNSTGSTAQLLAAPRH